MKGFKGFDKDLKCRGIQYAVGETATHSGRASLCHSGLHFTEHPLDTWSYYKPGDGSRYAQVEAEGVSEKNGKDSKRVAQSLKLEAEIKIPALLRAAVKFVFDRVGPAEPNVKATTGYSAHSATTGDSAHSATTGDSAHSATTGYYAHSATTGYSAHSATTGYSAHSATTGDSAHSATTGDSAKSSVAGKQSIAAALGEESAAKGPLGGWLVLSEWKDRKIKAMAIARVDGKKVKADTFYSLKGGKFVEIPD